MARRYPGRAESAAGFRAAQEVEDARRLPAESVKALQERGVPALSPTRSALRGGTRSTSTTRSADAGGALHRWDASVIGVHPWPLALFPAQAQNVWATTHTDVVVLRADRQAVLGDGALPAVRR